MSTQAEVEGSAISTSIDRSASAGFTNQNQAKPWQGLRQSFPYPTRYRFTRGVFKSGKVVEIAVVELSMQRLKGEFDVAKVHHPTAVGANLAGNVHRDMKGMAMQPRTLVTLWNVWKPVCRFEGELLEYFHLNL